MEKYKAKGTMTYAVHFDTKSCSYELLFREETVEDIIEHTAKRMCISKTDECRKTLEEYIIGQYTSDIYDLIPGEKFLEDVRGRAFIDSDGELCEIYVDGFKTNLGLCKAGICQGYLLLTGDAFEDLCENRKVEVNWANK